MSRQKHIGIWNLPTVSRKEAAAFWNMGVSKWLKRYRDDLGVNIRSFMNLHQWRYVLVDVLHAAFPEASNHTIHMMALQYLETRRQARIDANHASKSRGD
ncbi:hypothetical protein ACFL6S_14215 [Candidatus Poribacteria bacterium]